MVLFFGMLFALFLIGWIGFEVPASGREMAVVACALSAMALICHSGGDLLSPRN